MLLVTRDRLRAAGCCYPAARSDALVPPEGLTPSRVAELGVPYLDRTWAVMRASGLSREVEIEFAIREVGRTSPLHPDWEAWARRCLNGSDRSPASAATVGKVLIHYCELPTLNASLYTLRAAWASHTSRSKAESVVLGRAAWQATLWSARVDAQEGGPSKLQLARLLEFCEEVERRC